MPSKKDSKKEVIAGQGQRPLSEPLQDIVEMVAERPKLTQEEWEAANKAIPWLKAQLKIEVRGELEVEYAKKTAEQLDELKVLNKQYVDEQFAALKKAQEPLAQEELQKLLSQEYVEFEVLIKVPGKDGGKEKKQFTIFELPSSVEERFYKLLKQALIPILQERENISFKLEKGSLIDKIKIVLDASDKALELGNSLVAVILDPWEEDKSINKEWVSQNISVERQAAIILAQFEANKYRDFFFTGFKSFLNLK